VCTIRRVHHGPVPLPMRHLLPDLPSQETLADCSCMCLRLCLHRGGGPIPAHRPQPGCEHADEGGAEAGTSWGARGAPLHVRCRSEPRVPWAAVLAWAVEVEAACGTGRQYQGHVCCDTPHSWTTFKGLLESTAGESEGPCVGVGKPLSLLSASTRAVCDCELGRLELRGWVGGVLVCICQEAARVRGVDLDALVPLPALKTRCGEGYGMAACPALGLLVTSNVNDNKLNVFALPRSSGAGAGAGAGLVLLFTLGGAAPMHFEFDANFTGSVSGWMAFTGPATSRLLLVTDAGHDAVHVIDVVGRVHVGYVAAPSTVPGPRGVAARGSLVAVSAWKELESGDHVVCVLEGSGAMWTVLCVVGGGFGGPGSADGQLNRPYGLRFTGDGTGLAVADYDNGRVSILLVEDGAFVRHVATEVSNPWDVEECEAGWLVACGYPSGTVEFVGGGVGGSGVGRAKLGKARRASGDGESNCPSALALVPGLGLVVRENVDGGLQVFG
jgi:hypothetical protein